MLGVCGGLADYFGVDPVIVRIITIILLIAGVFPVIIAYFVLAIIIPLEGTTTSGSEDTIQENLNEVKNVVDELGRDIHRTFGGSDQKNAGTTPVHDTSTARSSSTRLLYLFGLVIILIGVFILLSNVFEWFWRYFWPVLLILAGALVIYLVARKK